MTPPAAPAAPPRFHFVDLLRGWAVLFMIETHVVNALLLPPLKEEWFYKILVFINGLVAPTFLFCAGFGFAISFSRKWGEYTTFRPVLWRYLQRLGFILGVAYALHIPFFSLHKMMTEADAAAWTTFFQSDILQIIALTLLLLVLLALVVRKLRPFLVVVTLLAAATVFLAPVVRAMDHSALPIWFRPYLSLQFKSQFPAFPWAAFLLAGALVGFAFVAARASGKERVLVNRLGLLSLAAIGVSLLAELVPSGPYGDLNFWNASPEFFFVRLGLVVLLCAALWHAGERREARKGSLLTMFGQESLLVYATHLLIVYGHTFDWSYISLFGRTLGYWECLGLTTLLTAAMYALAFAWHRLKGMNMRAAHAVQYATILGMAAYFVLK